MKDGIFEEAVNRILPRLHELPFDARRKRMTTIHRELNHEIAFVKGAPREVLQLCRTILINDEVVPLTNQLRTEILDVNDDYARRPARPGFRATQPATPYRRLHSREHRTGFNVHGLDGNDGSAQAAG